VCRWIAQRLDRQVITREDGKPYLIRFFLFKLPWRERPSVFLHLFLVSDADPELHNHPWGTSISLILSGGYREERRVGDKVIARVLRPGRFNVIRANDFHRIELLDSHVWTLFFAGQKEQSWGFWNRYTRSFTHHQAHHARRA
jgi:hypothetical protein